MQPLDFEVLDLQTPNHRPPNRQPANRQSADGTGANCQHPGRGRTNPSRCKLHRRRLPPATRWCREETERTSSGGHDRASLLHEQVPTQSGRSAADGPGCVPLSTPG
jgi:hypothetical protein